MCGLNDDYQHVIIITNLMQLMDLNLPFVSNWKECCYCQWSEK